MEQPKRRRSPWILVAIVAIAVAAWFAMNFLAVKA